MIFLLTKYCFCTKHHGNLVSKFASKQQKTWSEKDKVQKAKYVMKIMQINKIRHLVHSEDQLKS